ncbi:hypothetical protein H4R35_004375 [Dimargaris xerosporica]|nr:hypothetical protein H4R35_004375 [Dimargaris xerosporica]
MRFYVTAFAVAIVSAPELAASTSLHRRWEDNDVPQNPLDLSKTSANLVPPKGSSEHEFQFSDYIHTGSDYYPSDNEDEITDDEARH